MCGIGGILRVTPNGERHEPIPKEWADQVDRAIAWRGPDGCGRFRDVVVQPDGTTLEVVLVHRRLSIIDLEGGSQPMVSVRERSDRTPAPLPGATDDLAAVVFNGCIYNHVELRASLERNGHVFVTDHSDTEVLLNSYREWHASMVEELDGMYAAAVWDRRGGMLTLYRDRFGEKPLFWCVSADRKTRAFASVPGVLEWLVSCQQQPTVEKQLAARESVATWVNRGYSEVTAPFPSVERVPPGRPVMLYPVGGWPDDVPRSWVSSLPGKEDVQAIESAADVGSLLRAAVESRLDADVPVGVLLSGGIDSSLIACYAAQRQRNVHAFCARMPDQRYDESEHAAAVARHLGVRLEVIECDGATAANDLQRLIVLMQTPFADSSLLPTYWLCRGARRSIKVALSGDGGDELFYGYDRYRAVSVLRRWGWLLQWVPMRGLNRRDPKSRTERLARLIDAARGAGWPELGAIFGHEDRLRLFRHRDHHGHVSPWSRLSDEDCARRLDIVGYLPGDLLRKVDAASLAAGLEVRCPFLEPVLSARALATPYRVHTRNGRSKALLRELAAEHLPAEICDRPKQGFAIPIGEWFRSGLGGLKDLLTDLLGSADPFGIVGEALELDMRSINTMVSEHMNGRRDHGQRLYALLVLSIWAKSEAAIALRRL